MRADTDRMRPSQLPTLNPDKEEDTLVSARSTEIPRPSRVPAWIEDADGVSYLIEAEEFKEECHER